MDYLQAQAEEANKRAKLQLLKLVYFFNFIALVTTFTLNFLGFPALKYIYLIHVSLTIFSIIAFEFNQIFPIIMTLFFIEGQGRILWEYNDWARIIFDSLVFAAVMKIFIVRKKVVDFRKVPTPLIVIIALHFLWFLVEFTNLYSLSAFSVLASSKVYIYPLLFFLD